MQKVIGLDIGSYSIKAVEIVNTFKTYEITNFYEKIIPTGDDINHETLIPTCLEQLFKENDLTADRIITAMPGQYVSSRIIPMAFSDSRKIEMSIFSEVEDAVPFDLTDMIVDHQILGSTQGRTLTMVVMTKKVFLHSFLDHLQRVNIDPKLIDIDSLSFYNLTPYLNIAPGECIALIDIGHEKTSVCIVQDGLLRMFRSINLGGLFLSEFLARDLEVKLPEAQQIKHRVSRVIAEADPAKDLPDDDRMIADRITLAANAIVKELGRTFYAFKTWDRTEIKKVFLSGGTPRIKSIDHYLSEQLEIPVVLNHLEQTNLKISPNLTPYASIMPQSIAIGMRAVVSVRRHSQINLRKGEFAYIQNYEQILKWAGIAAKFMAVGMLLLTVSYGVKRIFYGGQIDELEKQYVKEYSQIYVGGKRKVNTNVPFAKLQTDVKNQVTRDIDAFRSSVQTFVTQNTRSDSLKALYEISAGIPKTLKVDVTTFTYTAPSSGPGKVALRGETDGYATVASIIEALKKVPSLSEVEEKQSGGKPGTDGKVIEFTINASFRAADARPEKS